ncbi:4'-phosphopantetheinyl transferase superfamily protein [Variovorax ginsengisoli]|uniref:4'-phosphopantetheinyl transferase superfamily protein n=1 Tax=Variovorax guangxiensis TaxID=1775474 RepID=A0A502DTE9_9BURK|nr:4'-phosphopantetheinyl transferase superfamily protein [Variovorax ginsengisoli]TPG28607.1 4'-phosphopantetheinyl transferase superfamily protein [Variovorax guangxiensis]
MPCELWRFPLDQYLPAAAIATLSADEVARARRFVFEADRHRFMAARAALRQLIGQRTGTSPAALRFATGRFGKPALATHDGLQFNLSHSGATGVLAMSTRIALGVDVEVVRPVPDADSLAAAYFAPAERAAIAACSANTRDTAFLRCWTRKEACLKAIGIGLNLATAGFDVGADADTRRVEIATADGIQRLWLRDVDAGDGLVVSLALCIDRAPAAQPSPTPMPTPAEESCA